ncbi:hypothetical protein ACHAPJ_010805 [Fusarium lateritium]
MGLKNQARYAYLPTAMFRLLYTSGQAANCTNVTIHNADEAKEVAKNCKVLTGELTLDSDLNETISLDGVETIQGDVSHNGCYRVSDDGCFPVPKPFKISSSTLTHINGSLYFWAFNGLEEISFPNLERVEKSFTIKRMHSLKRMDLTKLSYLGNILIEARNCTKIDHDGLRNFTNGSSNGGIVFWSAAVESIDSWFKYPIEAVANYTNLPRNSWPPTVDVGWGNLPNVKSLTVNWPKVDEIRIQGDGITLILGGENTTTMELDRLTIEGNNTSIDRGSDMKRIVVGNVSVEHFDEPGTLDLSPLDSISNLRLHSNDGLNGIKLPRAATSWKDFGLSISACWDLNLTSEYRDAENEKERFWYWPEGDIRSITISGTPLANDFL